MLLGSLNRERGEFEEATALYQRILALSPEDPSALNNLGNVYRDQGHLKRAMDCFRRAVRRDPSRIELLRNLGAVCLDANELVEAGACFDRILVLAPDDANAANARGIISRKLGEPSQALDLFHRALSKEPSNPHALSNLGNALRDLGRFEEAIASYRKALELLPGSSVFLSNLAGALQDNGENAEAECVLRDLVAADPRNGQARFDLGLLLLLTGRLEEGWTYYASRWDSSAEVSAMKLRFSQATWHGEDIGRLSLLIHREQGFGDTIQFLRYLPLVRKCLPLAQLYFVVQPALRRLVSPYCRRHDVTVVEEGTQLPSFDRWCMLLDLPGIFRTNLDDIPAGVPYLFAEKVFLLGWMRRLLDLGGLIVGLVWAGSPTNARDGFRSVSLELLSPLLEISGIQWVSLQVGARSGEIRASRIGKVADWSEDIVDFADTATLVSALDLVIGVDTAVIHLAGALGKPVWVLVRQGSEWRWMLDRADSPWYPTMRLYRQAKRGEWAPEIAQIKHDLVSYIESRGRPR